MLKNASNQSGANSVTVVLLHKNSGPRKLVAFCVRFGSRAIQGIASNILGNKGALVMRISTLAFTLFVREHVALYTKQDYLFHINTTLNVEVLPNLTNNLRIKAPSRGIKIVTV